VSGTLDPGKVRGRLRNGFSRLPRSAFGLTVEDGSPQFYLGYARLQGDVSFTRASTAVAMGNGETENYLANEPRYIGDKLILDAGGTNIVPQPTDFSNAAWTKTNMGTPSLTTGPGGANTAYAIRETTASGAHSIVQILSGLSSEDQFTIMYLVEPVGRDYAYVIVQNASTAKNFQGRVDFANASFLSGYPAGSGAGTISGGVVEREDGFFLIWITGIFTAAETGLRIHLGTMSNSSTTSFAGETDKGLNVAGIWGLSGVGAPVSFLTGTRAAETYTAPIPEGAFLARVVDELGETLTPIEGPNWNVAAQANAFEIESVNVYPLALYDDTSAQSDTADGATISPSYGPDLVPLAFDTVNGFPMEASPTGRIENGRFHIDPVSGDAGTVYWTADLGADGAAVYAAADVVISAGVNGGDPQQTNMSFTIGFSANLNRLTESMTVHVVFDQDGFRAQYRTISGGFVTRAHLYKVQSTGTFPASVRLHGNRLTISYLGETITVEDDEFAAFDARYVFFELQATSNNTTRLIEFENPQIGEVEIGPRPDYTASVPVNLAAPAAVGTAVAGNLYTIQRGQWTSNNGALTFAQKWQFDLADIPGATNTSYQTTNGVDEGKKIRVGETATNTSGAAAAYVFSAESAALA
jgi:hypothetical protein